MSLGARWHVLQSQGNGQLWQASVSTQGPKIKATVLL